MSPAPTDWPATTSTKARYDTEAFRSPEVMVTVNIPATEPANETVPVSGALTPSPGSAARSTPQCPAYMPTGANGAITGPGTGGSRQTRPINIHKAEAFPASRRAQRTESAVVWEGG